jgi:hypothetical protein
MAVRAYVLIQTEVGRAVTVTREVGALEGVVSADDVTGPYDVIVGNCRKHPGNRRCQINMCLVSKLLVTL